MSNFSYTTCPAWPWTEPWMRCCLWKTLLLVSVNMHWQMNVQQNAQGAKMRVRNSLCRGNTKTEEPWGADRPWHTSKYSQWVLCGIHHWKRGKKWGGRSSTEELLWTYCTPTSTHAREQMVGRSQEWIQAWELGQEKWVFLFSLHKNTWIGLN